MAFLASLIVKAIAQRRINPAASAHWLRHAHASHAIDEGAPITLVSQTLGHADLKSLCARQAERQLEPLSQRRREAMSEPRFKRFPPPWRLEEMPGGYRVADAHGRPLAYVDGVDGSARSALPGSLTPAEARAIATAISRLPELFDQ